MLKIYIDSLEVHERTQTTKLLDFYAFADKNKYSLEADPENADLILICDVRFDEYGKFIRENKLIRSFLHKCFILSNNDRPLPLFRGILTSGEKKIINFGRFRSCSYNAYSDNFKNPFIGKHDLQVKAPVQKKFLFSFIGRDCSTVRSQILSMKFKRTDIYIEDSGAMFTPYEKRMGSEERQKHYYDIMLQSKFVLCPEGWSASSYRLFEALRLGIVPVIISEKWLFPKGPVWKNFSLILSEKDIPFLENIIKQRESEFAAMGLRARKAFEDYFSDEVFFDYIVSNCVDIKRRQVIPEAAFFYLITPLYVKFLKFRDRKGASLRNGLNLLRSQPKEFLKKSNLQKIKRFIKPERQK